MKNQNPAPTIGSSLARTSRRSVLRTLAGAATLPSLPNILLAQGSPNSRLNIAAIGVGGKGATDVKGAAEGANMVALCDVDSKHLEKTAADYPDAKTFDDFRVMIDTLGDKIDGVLVSTPDHSHFPAAMHAIQAGKHVCIQKPLVNTLHELRILDAAARAKGIVTNMGNQGHTGGGIRKLKSWIHHGAIGAVREIHLWTNRPIWPQGVAQYTPATAPDTVSWELWQAANPSTGFIDGVHPFNWRGHRLYGAGAMGDMGCHILDGPYFACGLTTPTRISAEAHSLTDVSWPIGSKITCEFGREKITLMWYDGKDTKDQPIVPTEAVARLEHLTMLAPTGKKPEWVKTDPRRFGVGALKGGFIIVGEKGAIGNFGDYCEAPFLFGQENHEKWVATNPPTIVEASLAPGNPQLEWVRAIEQSKSPGANFDYAVPLTQLCLLGNLAIQANAPVTWNQEAFSSGSAEIDKHLRRPAYRDGWTYGT